jgi:hypothetical protein
MPVTDNIDDLVNDILKTVDYVEKDIPSELSELAFKLQRQLQQGDFKNRTGNLRQSMSVSASDESLKISMLFYGYFLSFGVDGRKRKGAFGLTEDVAAAFNEPVGYKFGSKSNSKYVAGINARRFYPEDITDTIIEIMEKSVL